MKFKICSLLVLSVVLSACGGNEPSFVDDSDLPEVPVIEVVEEIPTLSPIPEATETLPPPIVVESPEPEIDDEVEEEDDDIEDESEGEGEVEAAEVEPEEEEEPEPEEPEDDKRLKLDDSIALDEPAAGTILVSGYMVFLEGEVLDPIDNTLTLGVLMDDCTDFVSRQPITIGATAGSWSTWNAQIILPRQLQGEGCLVAYTGEYGLGDWRETRIPVTIVDEKDDRVDRVEILDTFEGVLAQGDRLYVSGMAIDTDEIELNLLRDGEEEIASVLVPVDDFGFWEVDFQIPAENAIGEMELEAVIPDADEEEDAVDSFEFEVR